MTSFLVRFYDTVANSCMVRPIACNTCRASLYEWSFLFNDRVQIKSNLFASTKYKEKQLKNIRLTQKKSTTNRPWMLAGLKGRETALTWALKNEQKHNNDHVYNNVLSFIVYLRPLELGDYFHGCLCVNIFTSWLFSWHSSERLSGYWKYGTKRLCHCAVFLSNFCV